MNLKILEPHALQCDSLPGFRHPVFQYQPHQQAPSTPSPPSQPVPLTEMPPTSLPLSWMPWWFQVLWIISNVARCGGTHGKLFLYSGGHTCRGSGILLGPVLRSDPWLLPGEFDPQLRSGLCALPGNKLSGRSVWGGSVCKVDANELPGSNGTEVGFLRSLS